MLGRRLQAELTDATLTIPQYYFAPIHAYADGNLCWDSAMEVRSTCRDAVVYALMSSSSKIRCVVCVVFVMGSSDCSLEINAAFAELRAFFRFRLARKSPFAWLL